MIKIGLAGKMASGKTALAEHFLNTYGGSKVSFADKLKNDVVEYGLTIDGQIVKSRDRKLLQDYGQFRRGEVAKIEIPEVNISLLNEMGHFILKDKDGIKHILGSCEPNHWLNQGVAKADALIATGTNVILDDLRFVNECEYLKAHGFVIIKINASQAIREERLLARDGGFNPANFTDVSEIQFDDMVGHYEIQNEKNDDSAQKQLDEIVALIKN